MHGRDVLKASAMTFGGAVASNVMNRPLLAEGNPVFEHDVCVVGGGSAGT
jgi:hypothetical protein